MRLEALGEPQQDASLLRAAQRAFGPIMLEEDTLSGPPGPPDGWPYYVFSPARRVSCLSRHAFVFSQLQVADSPSATCKAIA